MSFLTTILHKTMPKNEICFQTSAMIFHFFYHDFPLSIGCKIVCITSCPEITMNRLCECDYTQYTTLNDKQ